MSGKTNIVNADILPAGNHEFNYVVIARINDKYREFSSISGLIYWTFEEYVSNNIYYEIEWSLADTFSEVEKDTFTQTIEDILNDTNKKMMIVCNLMLKGA